MAAAEGWEQVLTSAAAAAAASMLCLTPCVGPCSGSFKLGCSAGWGRVAPICKLLRYVL
jgi:hypothetical protein